MQKQKTPLDKTNIKHGGNRPDFSGRKYKLIGNLFKQLVNRKKTMPIDVFKAFNIAIQTLRLRYTSRGIVAGKTHFSDMWLRDSCFASLGSLAIHDFDIVKKNLITFLNYTDERGQIPLRIGQKYFFLKLLGIQKPVLPRYLEDKGVSVPADSNTLFIISAEFYLQQSHDVDFAREHFYELKRVVDWSFNLDEDHDLLIEEGPYASWADSIRKRGKVLYSNVLHCKALDSFSQICRMLNKRTEAAHYENLHRKVKERINDLFWNGQYYIDWIHRHRHTYFSLDGNLLAIVFGLADKSKSIKILKHIHELDLDHNVMPEPNFPRYRSRHIFPWFFPFQIQDYHNGLYWLWISCVFAVAKYRYGDKEDAERILLAVAKKINEYNGVYEVYFQGKPVRRFFYKSENGFAWSAGLFVWACKETGLI